MSITRMMCRSYHSKIYIRIFSLNLSIFFFDHESLILNILIFEIGFGYLSHCTPFISFTSSFAFACSKKIFILHQFKFKSIDVPLCG